ncbi:MAG TPA: sulfotransferase [Verrucomicrobiae bacterium]|jgi:tetratricopeptide (TPR) repeat protein
MIQNPRDAARWQQAKERLLGGRYREAVAGYRQLLAKYPASAELWFEFGNASAGELDFAAANSAYERALKLAPRSVPLLLLVAQQYQGLRQLDKARACLEQAAAADPASVDARISLAVWFEKERRLDEAWQCLEQCLARHPRDDQARYFRAFLLHRKGLNTEAETALRDLIRDGPRYPYVQYASRHLLGVVLDQSGACGEAMKWLREAKALVRQITDIGLLEREYDRTARHRQEFMAALTSDAIRGWREKFAGQDGKNRLAFLGGHPRSGTTLLEQILDAHPDLIGFDESAAFNQELAQRLVLPSGAAEAMAALEGISSDRLAEIRRRYLATLLQEIGGRADDRMLLDKNPSATMSLHLWLRVFPEIKVVVALRDPRDVVLSCYFQNLMLNATNANFLSLERTAKHYADLMDVWLRHRELGGFDSLETRYEDVVNDMQSEGRRVTEFLGLAWHENQARFHESSRRKFLYAPTYHDVTKPVYRSAVGRWHRYARELEPIQPILASYCKAFGYESS